MINLLTLDLSNNRLKDFSKTYEGYFGENSLLQSAIKLETLYLAHNQLKSLYADWRISMTNLQVLDLSYNNFTILTVSKKTNDCKYY